MKDSSAKTINFITIVLSTIFFLAASLSTISLVSEEYRVNAEFRQILQDIEAFNHKHNKDNGPIVEVPAGEKLFNNGADAFVAAYNNYINADSYHVETHGTMINTVNLIGLTIETESTNIMIKYPDGSAVYELISYEPGNKYGRSSAMHIYYDKGADIIYMRETNKVEKVGERLVPTYTNGWIYDNVQYFEEELGIMPGASIYDITRRNVVETKFYNEVKNSKGEVVEYQTQVLNNPARAGAPYSRVINYIGQATKMPTIKEMKASAIISGDGMLKNLTLNDNFEVHTSVPVLGSVAVDCRSTSKYNFITIGGEVELAKPVVLSAEPR